VKHEPGQKKKKEALSHAIVGVGKIVLERKSRAAEGQKASPYERKRKSAGWGGKNRVVVLEKRGAKGDDHGRRLREG